jgi:hypothetical protein
MSLAMPAMYGATDDEQDTPMVSCTFLPDGSCMPELCTLGSRGPFLMFVMKIFSWAGGLPRPCRTTTVCVLLDGVYSPFLVVRGYRMSALNRLDLV